MTEVPLWLIYKLVDNGSGRFTKPPMSPFTGEVCSKKDPGMYADFMRAMAGVEAHDADGVGFVFLNGFVAIDLDDCFQEDGTLTEMAADIVDHFINTYMEYSPSGNGLHIFCKGTKPYQRTRGVGIEVYTGENFVTVTGDHVKQSGEHVLNCQEELNWLFEKYLPEAETKVSTEVIYVDHGDKSPQEWLETGLTHDDKLHRLYNDTDHMDDESGHDLALLCKLAYWLNRDTDAMTTAFFNSPWVHSKDVYHIKKVDQRSDYYERTLMKALTTCTTCASSNERKLKNISTTALQIEENAAGEVLLPLTDYTDVGNARAFASLYKEQFAYTEEFGWCFFTGLNWELGKSHDARQAGIEFAENLMYLAKRYWEKLEDKCAEEGCTPSSREGKIIMAPAIEFMKHAERTNSERGITSLLSLAESMMRVPATLFDSNPWVLNTPNVVVDLRTGEAYPPAWNHYNSMMTGIVYEPDAPNNGLWDEFLQQIFCKDKDLISYMQMVLGAACVGKVYEEKLLIAVGSGSNGKSTMFNVLKAVLGDYCVNVNPDILMDKVNYEQQVAVTSIKGRRLVIGQETESGQKLSTASVKRMVSSDSMIGRVLHRGYIEFEPTHTIMLATNHLPKVTDDDEGTWRRLTVVPFNATIPREEIITNYQDILLSEDGAYVLKWLIEGAVRFYENGCTFSDVPYAVNRSTWEYRTRERSSVETFCEDCLEFVDQVKYPDVWIASNDLYEAYKEWCDYAELRVCSKDMLTKRVIRNGAMSKIKRLNGKPVRVMAYVKLKSSMDGLEAIEG